MKHLNYKFTIAILLSLLVGILTSFSTISKREEAISRNIEAISRGEGSSSDLPCIFQEGKCIIKNKIYPGMTMKY